MTDKPTQNDESCPKCGAPMTPAGSLSYASRVDVCSIKGQGCEYAAGLREQIKTLRKQAHNSNQERLREYDRAEKAEQERDKQTSLRKRAVEQWEAAERARGQAERELDELRSRNQKMEQALRKIVDEFAWYDSEGLQEAREALGADDEQV